MENQSISIRATLAGDIEHLPNVERSAAQIYKEDDTFSWVADGNVQSISVHQSYTQSGNSWVASCDGQSIGFINGVVHNNIFHICELSVSNEWQKKGVGSALLCHVENIMRERKLSAITLITFKNIPWNAPFYESKGFSIIDDNNLSLFLIDVLEEEAEAGLDIQARCAMQKSL